MGTRCGTNVSETSLPAISPRICRISGVCLCTAAAYAATVSLHSGKCVFCVSFLPAPVTPDLLSIIIPLVSISPSLKAGKRASSAHVGIAARVGYYIGGLNSFSVKLGKTIYTFFVQLFFAENAAIVFFILGFVLSA